MFQRRLDHIANSKHRLGLVFWPCRPLVEARLRGFPHAALAFGEFGAVGLQAVKPSLVRIHEARVCQQLLSKRLLALCFCQSACTAATPPLRLCGRHNIRCLQSSRRRYLELSTGNEGLKQTRSDRSLSCLSMTLQRTTGTMSLQ